MSNTEHSIATYVSDMLALERHIRIPFDTQLKDEDFNDFRNAKALVVRLAGLVDRHVAALDALLKAEGGQEASPIKSAVSQFEGMIAGAIDKVRKTKVSKALRDDYTALSLCNASYTLLHATAHALGSENVASLAKRHLEDYASCVMEIGRALPEVCVQELLSIGLPVQTAAASESVDATQQAWRVGQPG